MRSKCQKVGNRLVCGMLHGGGRAGKSGVYRLAKGEQVFTPGQLKTMKKKHSSHASHGKKKKCRCKHK